MTIDQVVATLTAEGYSGESIRAVMDALAEADWREEDEDWSQKDLGTLRTQLGTPASDPPDRHLANHPDDLPPRGPGARSDVEVWAADLSRVLDRTTGGKTPLSTDQIRRVADHLLHRSSGLWDSDFTVNHWAEGIAQAIRVETHGQVGLSHEDLQVVANLLLHAQEDDWVPQAALLRAEHPSALDDRPQNE